jgi:hypothetical protein
LKSLKKSPSEKFLVKWRRKSYFSNCEMPLFWPVIIAAEIKFSAAESRLGEGNSLSGKAPDRVKASGN